MKYRCSNQFSLFAQNLDFCVTRLWLKILICFSFFGVFRPCNFPLNRDIWNVCLIGFFYLLNALSGVLHSPCEPAWPAIKTTLHLIQSSLFTLYRTERDRIEIIEMKIFARKSRNRFDNMLCQRFWVLISCFFHKCMSAINWFRRK